MFKTAMICFKKKPKVVTAKWGGTSDAIERNGNYLLPYEWHTFFSPDDYEVVVVDPADEPLDEAAEAALNK